MIVLIRLVEEEEQKKAQATMKYDMETSMILRKKAIIDSTTTPVMQRGSLIVRQACSRTYHERHGIKHNRDEGIVVGLIIFIEVLMYR
jgi:hypothetical protein